MNVLSERNIRACGEAQGASPGCRPAGFKYLLSAGLLAREARDGGG